MTACNRLNASCELPARGVGRHGPPQVEQPLQLVNVDALEPFGVAQDGG